MRSKLALHEDAARADLASSLCQMAEGTRRAYEWYLANKWL